MKGVFFCKETEEVPDSQFFEGENLLHFCSHIYYKGEKVWEKEAATTTTTRVLSSKGFSLVKKKGKKNLLMFIWFLFCIIVETWCISWQVMKPFFFDMRGAISFTLSYYKKKEESGSENHVAGRAWKSISYPGSLDPQQLQSYLRQALSINSFLHEMKYGKVHTIFHEKRALFLPNAYNNQGIIGVKKKYGRGWRYSWWSATSSPCSWWLRSSSFMSSTLKRLRMQRQTLEYIWRVIRESTVFVYLCCCCLFDRMKNLESGSSSLWVCCQVIGDAKTTTTTISLPNQFVWIKLLGIGFQIPHVRYFIL